MDSLDKGFFSALGQLAGKAVNHAVLNTPRNAARQQIWLHAVSAKRAIQAGQTSIAHSHISDAFTKYQAFKRGVAHVHPEVHEFTGMTEGTEFRKPLPITKTHSFRDHPGIASAFQTEAFNKAELTQRNPSTQVSFKFKPPVAEQASDYGVGANRVQPIEHPDYIDNQTPKKPETLRPFGKAITEDEEVVHHPALQLGNGKVYTGPTHFEASKAALAAGENKQHVVRALLGMGQQGSTGFTTSKRDFVSRKEAYKIAYKQHQLDPADDQAIEDRELDSGDYRRPSMLKSITAIHRNTLPADTKYGPAQIHWYDLQHHSGTTGHMMFTIKHNGDAYVHGIEMPKPGETLDRNQGMNHKYTGQNQFGPRDILGLQRQLLRNHPEIKRFTSDSRITGVRAGSSSKTHIAHAPVSESRRQSALLSKSFHLNLVQKEEHADGIHHHYDLTHHSGAKGYLELAVQGNEGYVHDIGMGGGKGDWEHYEDSKNHFGPKEILGLQREVLKRHPQITHFSGFRITGAREASQAGKTTPDISIPAHRQAPSMVKAISTYLVKALRYDYTADKEATRLAMDYLVHKLQSNPEALREIGGELRVMSGRDYGVGSLALKPVPFDRINPIAQEIMMRAANNAIARAQGLENKPDTPPTATPGAV